MQSLAQTTINDFKASLQGEVLRANDPGYRAARHVAILTFGVLQEGRAHPQNQDFLARGEPLFAAAASMPGFVHVIEGKDPNQEPFSAFLVAEKRAYVAQVLSLWANLESLFVFAYYHLHAEALGKRKAWFLKPEWPTYVLWWVSATHIPNWDEAYQHHDYLHRYGASPQAFDFKHPFDALGNPTHIDRVTVDKLVRQTRTEHCDPSA